MTTANNYFKILAARKVVDLVPFDDTDPGDIDRALEVATTKRRSCSENDAIVCYRMNAEMLGDPRLAAIRCTLPCPRHEWRANKTGAGSICRRCGEHTEVCLDVLALLPASQ